MSLKFKERKFRYERPDILNGMYLLKYGGTFFGLWGINGYFLLADNIFLDTGNHNSDRNTFIKFLKTLDRGRDWKVLNTHLHEDHCGKNTIVQKILGAEIYSPERVDDFTFVSWMMDLVWGRPEVFTHSMLDNAVYETDNGRTIEVIPTPGHSPAHTAFRVMPDNIVYSGDAIPLPVKKRYITSGENYMEEIESLKRLLKFAGDGSLFVSAHHGILKDPVRTISERISGMSETVGEVSSLLDKGQDNIGIISELVFGRPDFIYRRLGDSIRCRQDWTISSIVEGLKR
ncbi:MAG TPA: MBL fold metallo-hydrolase [Spirochaetota bacterium]|nr:MBL fold metallo-hydrolase [Spirochaetota bacterium]